MKQLLYAAPLRRVSRDGQQCPIVLNVLPHDKRFMTPPKGRDCRHWSLELDQCGVE